MAQDLLCSVLDWTLRHQIPVASSYLTQRGRRVFYTPRDVLPLPITAPRLVHVLSLTLTAPHFCDVVPLYDLRCTIIITCDRTLLAAPYHHHMLSLFSNTCNSMFSCDQKPKQLDNRVAHMIAYGHSLSSQRADTKTDRSCGRSSCSCDQC